MGNLRNGLQKLALHLGILTGRIAALAGSPLGMAYSTTCTLSKVQALQGMFAHTDNEACSQALSSACGLAGGSHILHDVSITCCSRG